MLCGVWSDIIIQHFMRMRNIRQGELSESRAAEGGAATTLNCYDVIQLNSKEGVLLKETFSDQLALRGAG